MVHFNDDDVYIALDQLIQSDTLSRFRVNQPLLLLLNVAGLITKQKIPFAYSLVEADGNSNQESNYYTKSALWSSTQQTSWLALRVFAMI